VEKLTSLTKLGLSETRIGDAGLRCLSKLPQLTILDITSTRATNSCLRTLAALPSLELVHTQETAIDASSEGFVGILIDGEWFPNEAKAKEAVEAAGGEK